MVDKTHIHIADEERMNKGVDNRNRSKSGHVRDGLSQDPLEPNSESPESADDASNTQSLPVEQ